MRRVLGACRRTRRGTGQTRSKQQQCLEGRQLQVIGRGSECGNESHQFVQLEVLAGLQELLQLRFQAVKAGRASKLKSCQDEQLVQSLFQQQLLVMRRKSLKSGHTQCPRY